VCLAFSDSGDARPLLHTRPTLQRSSLLVENDLNSSVDALALGNSSVYKSFLGNVVDTLHSNHRQRKKHQGVSVSQVPSSPPCYIRARRLAASQSSKRAGLLRLLQLQPLQRVEQLRHPQTRQQFTKSFFAVQRSIMSSYNTSRLCDSNALLNLSANVAHVAGVSKVYTPGAGAPCTGA